MATNRPNVLDPALLHLDRLDRKMLWLQTLKILNLFTIYIIFLETISYFPSTIKGCDKGNSI